MIIKREITALAAGGTVANVWSGSAFEYLRGPSFVSMGIVSLTTFALKGLLSTMYIGANLIAEEFTVPNIDPAIAGRDHPLIADDFYIQAAGNGGDRVVTTVRNPTAGAITGTAVIQVVPAGRGR